MPILSVFDYGNSALYFNPFDNPQFGGPSARMAGLGNTNPVHRYELGGLRTVVGRVGPLAVAMSTANTWSHR